MKFLSMLSSYKMPILDVMNSFYTNLKFGPESEEFLDSFINSYKEKIYEMAETKNLADIQSSFSKLTPKKIRTSSVAATDFMASMKNTKENGRIFLEAVVNNLAGILLTTVFECSIGHKQKKVYPSCIILGISNDKELTKLSNKLGYFIPPKIVNDTDSRTTEKLKESLGNKYKGLKYFSRNELLFLSQPEKELSDENELILFYTNKYNANNKKDYSFDNIVKNWDDYKLETNDTYIYWLFPEAPKLTKDDIKRFQTDPKLRVNVVDASLRMLVFYGFVLNKKEIVKQIKPLNRRDKGRTIGLFSIHNYKRITRIMEFLIVINMEILSAIFFLAMCKAMKSNDVLLKKIIDNNTLRMWMSTQNYLASYANSYDVNRLSKTLVVSNDDDDDDEDDWGEWDDDWDDDWGEWEDDWDDISSELLYESDELETKPKTKSQMSKKMCKVTGLNYTGNSCYMDSVLLCIFAIPNKVITNNILEKDLNILKTIDRPLWSKCSSNIDNDIKKRQNIQIVLNNITNSMRGNGTVKTCSKLRSLIKECPGTQPFHNTEPQDSGEFLAYLLNLFQVDIATVIRQTYGSNSSETKTGWVLVRSNKDKYASPIIDVTSTKLLTIKKGYDITKFLKQTDDALLKSSELWTPDKTKPHITYNRRKEVFRMYYSSLVIFNLNRTYGEAMFSKPITKKEIESGRGKFTGIVTREIFKHIYAPEKMIIKEKQLNLSAIVVHTGGAHYIAFIKYNGEWYRYNNVAKDKITYTGSYDNMLKSNPNPMSHGTLFFYT